MTAQTAFDTNSNALIECEGECGNEVHPKHPFCNDCTEEMSQSQRNAYRYIAYTRRNLSFS